MANVQDVSCFHEGADDGHWADGCVLSPGSEANGQTEAPGLVCLGERSWHKFVRDLEMIDVAFEPEELRETSTGKDS
jgi:hypothetical protein